MGYTELVPLGDEEARAFDVFMKLYIKSHPDQGEDDSLWNGRNNWGKLTKEQKKLFAVKPKLIKKSPIAKNKRLPKPKVGRTAAHKRLSKPKGKVPKRVPIQKKQKQPTKPKTLLGRPPKPQGRKLTNKKQTKKLEQKKLAEN